LHTGSDFKCAEQLRKSVGVDKAFRLPGTVLLTVQPVQQECSGEAVGIALAGEAKVDIFEELAIGIEVEVVALIEDDVHGLADVAGPGAGDFIGELEERLDELHATGMERGEALREVLFGVDGPLLKMLKMLPGPGGEALLENFGIAPGGAEVEALYAVG